MGSTISKSDSYIVKFKCQNSNVTSLIGIICDKPFFIKLKKYNIRVSQNEYLELLPVTNQLINNNNEYELIINKDTKIKFYSTNQNGIIQIFNTNIDKSCSFNILSHRV